MGPACKLFQALFTTPGILESSFNYFFVNIFYMHIYIKTYWIVLTMSLLEPNLPFFWMTLFSIHFIYNCA